ncbi:MAG: N-acetyltransferase [Chloroflexus aggregans]|uniref:N-acetyltransferase n=1 Tax=Chloroflexus aggregans TaxID=152260 RepID=A0A2J6X320_9CHLR|nr:MAG: N-acetyltransferase [Chloroflexus aggregans]
MLTIRPFQANQNDYQVMARVYSALVPDAPLIANEWQVRDKLHNPQLILYRVIGELDDVAAGYAEFVQPMWCADPYYIETLVYVHPAYQGRGLGTALWQHLQQAWQQYRPRYVLAKVHENWQTGFAFAVRHGFHEQRRVWTSRLDVTNFDPTSFQSALERVTRQRIEIHSFAALAAADSDFWHKLYEFERQVTVDVPSAFPVAIPPYEQWIKLYQPEHGAIWEGSFAAMADGQVVGLSTLETIDNETDVEVGFTAVRRDYRGRGIALALKLHTIAYAQTMGVTGIRTDNDSTNQAMWHINQRLGFHRGPVWVVLRRQEQEEVK